MTSPAELSHFLDEISDAERNTLTSWNERKIAGVELQESASTTHPPNSRFNFVRNGNYLNPDEVDNQVTHNKPLYELPLNSNDVWVVGGADREAYVPGFESISGVSFQTQSPSGGRFLPKHLDVLEGGYAVLHGQTLTGVPNESFNYSKQGLVVHIEERDADLRAYKDGNIADSLSVENWKINPFASNKYKFDSSKFVVVRIVFDLYGAGDATFFLKVRNIKTGESDYLEIGTLSVPDSPLLSVYNLKNQVRFEAASNITGSPVTFIGPVEFHNRFRGTNPSRQKADPLRNIDVNDSTGANNWTVVRVYRVDIDRREASSILNTVNVSENSTNVNIMVKAVHRDFLTFPNDFDPDDDSNWITPGGAFASKVKETSIEVADLDSDQVSISTFTDEDNQTKVRGRKELTVAITSAQGNRGESRERKGTSPITELEYIVLLAQVGSTNENINLIEPVFNQRW